MEFFDLWVFNQSEQGVEITPVGRSVCIDAYIYSKYMYFFHYVSWRPWFANEIWQADVVFCANALAKKQKGIFHPVQGIRLQWPG